MESILDITFGAEEEQDYGWQQHLVWHEASRLGVVLRKRRVSAWWRELVDRLTGHHTFTPAFSIGQSERRFLKSDSVCLLTLHDCPQSCLPACRRCGHQPCRVVNGL
jgi:hypothetical protein